MIRFNYIHIFFIITLFITKETLSAQDVKYLVSGNNCIKTLSDKCVYDNNNHAAFTALESFKGHLYLAFREGNAHVPTKDERVKIIILKKTSDTWEKDKEYITVPGGDLRDPCLLNWNNRLFLYTVGYYSELTDAGWTQLSIIKHNAPHFLNIWKIREYKGVLYGIGNANNKWPILLTSTDGVNWFVKEEFKLGGNATEADICFIKNKMYICFRVEEPQGSMSFWGVSSYPFDVFKWSTIDASVASPELIAVSRKKMLLTGREYIYNSKELNDGAYISLITINTKGEVLGRICLEDSTGDKGYPSIRLHNGKYYMSYYTGTHQTKIHLLELKAK